MSRTSRWLLALVAIFAWQARSLRAEEPQSAKLAADPMIGKEAGQVRDDNGLKMKLVWCPPGSFSTQSVEQIPGSKKPKTEILSVMVSQGFWIGKYELTQLEWMRSPLPPPRDNRRDLPWQKRTDGVQEGDEFPTTHVSWIDAMRFCHQMTEREREAAKLPNDWEYTLPTESQWEHACRAQSNFRFCFGDDESELGDYAWFVSNAAKAGEYFAHRVGQKKSNQWGLHDMHGNVLELCRDYFSSPRIGGRDPDVPANGTNQFRVAHGGDFATGATACTSSYRLKTPADFLGSRIGFRVALVPVSPKK